MASRQDFSLIRTQVEKFTEDYGLTKQTDGFLHGSCSRQVIADNF